MRVYFFFSFFFGKYIFRIISDVLEPVTGKQFKHSDSKSSFLYKDETVNNENI